MTFSPPRVAISAITQANPCVITTSSVNMLATGGKVRLHVPKNYGMTPLNNNIYSITVLTSTSFSIQYTQVPVGLNVDSTNYPAFTIPSNPGFTAEVISVGSGPTPLIATPGQLLNNICITTIDDQTRNISITNQPF